MDGIGFVFTADDSYFGLDLDDCIVDGELHPAAQVLINRLNTYTEISPSGNGVKAIGRGKLNTDRNSTATTPWGGRFEAYDHGRYFTVTGNSLPGQKLLPVAERQGELDCISRDLFPSKPTGGATAAFGGVSGGKQEEYETLLREAEEIGGWGEVRPLGWLVSRLTKTQQRYISAPYGEKRVPAYKKSRSEFEQSILTHLVQDGASDEQMRVLADSAFAKQIGRKTYSYINPSMQEARRWVFIERGRVSHPDGGWTKRRRIDLDAPYLALARGQKQAEWVTEVVALGKGKRTAYNIRDRLVGRGLLTVRDGCIHQREPDETETPG